MEIPADLTLKTLKGSWTLVPTHPATRKAMLMRPGQIHLRRHGPDPQARTSAFLSSPVNPTNLSQQGVGWLTRKGIGAATLTLTFESSVSDTQTTTITMRQTLTGGIAGSTEERIMDWTERERANHIYGNVQTRSQLVKGVKSDDGAFRPDLTLQSNSDNESIKQEIKNFLQAGQPYLAPGQDGDAEVPDLFIHDFGRNENGGWTAEQVCMICLFEAGLVWSC